MSQATGPLSLVEAQERFRTLLAPYRYDVPRYQLTETFRCKYDGLVVRHCDFTTTDFNIGEDSWEKVLKLVELTLEMNKVRGKKGL